MKTIPLPPPLHGETRLSPLVWPRRPAPLPAQAIVAVLSVGTVVASCTPTAAVGGGPRLFPANDAESVNPDTHLVLTFESPPGIGNMGLIRITDAETGEAVDTLDLSVPAGPHPSLTVSRAERAGREARGEPEPVYQETTIGGQAGFHFHPIIVRGNTATIYPHNKSLTYGREYAVQIDPGVLNVAGKDFAGFDERSSWRFETRATPPPHDSKRIVVAADGSADFNTVQGAIDRAPDDPAEPVEIFIRNGNYEEIVYFNGKSHLTIRGEDREKVVVGYGNNSSFNRIRPAFSMMNATDVELSSFTIKNTYIGQAEALKLSGSRNIIANMTLDGSGDAMTTAGTIYMVDSTLIGDGDTILAYGALYCLRCEIRSVGPFTWTRTPQGMHGNVFVDSNFVHLDEPLPWTVAPDGTGGRKVDGVLARLPQNGPVGSLHRNFPYAEMVLINSRADGVPPIGWGPVEDRKTFDWSNVHFWEYHTMDRNGRPIDLSKRHPIAHQLTLPEDEEIITNYSNPRYVLNGWNPVVR